MSNEYKGHEYELANDVYSFNGKTYDTLGEVQDAITELVDKPFYDVCAELDNSYYLCEIGRGDSLDQKTLGEIFKSEDFSHSVFDSMADQRSDNAHNEVKQFRERLNDDGFWESDYIENDFWDKYEDDIRWKIEELDKSTPEKDLFHHSDNLRVRIPVYSNFDCINSCFFEGSIEYDGYMGAIIDLLQINPIEVKRACLHYDLPISGKFPNKPSRKNPVVSAMDLIKSYRETGCGANLFTFFGEVDVYEHLGNGAPTGVTIPKGANCGYFSSTYGGSGGLDITTQRDFIFDSLQYGPTSYDSIEILPDEINGYSVRDVFGEHMGYFNTQLTLKY